MGIVVALRASERSTIRSEEAGERAPEPEQPDLSDTYLVGGMDPGADPGAYPVPKCGSATREVPPVVPLVRRK